MHGNNQEDSDKEIWGNGPTRKEDNTLKIGFQNIGMQKVSHKAFESTENATHISLHPYDVHIFCEHGLNQTKMKQEDHWQN